MSDQKPPEPARLAEARAFVIKATAEHQDDGSQPEWELRTKIPATDPEPVRRLRVARNVVTELEGQAERLEKRGSIVPSEFTRKLAEARAEAQFAETTVQASQQVDPWLYAYREGLAIAPYVDPLLAQRAVIASDALTTCIGTMGRGIAGHGYELVPRVGQQAFDSLTPKARKDIEAERFEIEHWFTYANPAIPFAEIYNRTVQMRETCAFSAWELLPDQEGRPAGIEPMPSYSVRITPQPENVLTPVPIQDKDGAWVYRLQWVRYRKIVQLINSRYVWFKFLGDPRFIDQTDGTVVGNEWVARQIVDEESNPPADPETRRKWQERRDEAARVLARCAELRAAGREAHEVMLFVHFGVSGGITPYGIPRWYAGTYSAIGRQKVQVLGMSYFDNNAIPRLAVLVSGATIGDAQRKQIEDYFRGIKGVENQHDVLVIEAAPYSSSNPGSAYDDARAQIKLDIKPLNEALLKEGTFRETARDWLNDVRRLFSLPPILTGDSDDYARAVADVARLLAEEQVFAPERVLFDFAINHQLFPRLGWKHWLFKSGGAHISDEAAVATLLELGHKSGAFTIEEMREFISTKLGKRLPPIGAAWAKKISLYIAAMAQGGPQRAPVDPAAGPIEPKQGEPGTAVVDEEDPDANPAEVEAGGESSGGAESDQAEAAADSGGDGEAPGKRGRLIRAIVPPEVLATAEGLLELRERIQRALAEAPPA